MNISIEHDGIDFFEEMVNDIVSTVFERAPSDVMVTDLSTIADFSVTQAELDRHLAIINEAYGIDMHALENYSLLTLCRAISAKQEGRLH